MKVGVFSMIICIIVFAVVGALAISPLAAVFVDEEGSSNIVFLAMLGVMALAVFLAPTARRAWGRASLIAGLLFVAMPLSMTALSGQVMTEMPEVAESGAAAAGAVIGSGIMVGASMFIGFILGAIFVILGLVLLLGGRREVIVVAAPPPLPR